MIARVLTATRPMITWRCGSAWCAFFAPRARATPVGCGRPTSFIRRRSILTSANAPDLEDLYPGDEWVDWIGLSIYNDGVRHPWRSFGQLFDGSYRIVAGLTDKPMMIAGTGRDRTGRAARPIESAVDRRRLFAGDSAPLSARETGQLFSAIKPASASRTSVSILRPMLWRHFAASSLRQFTAAPSATRNNANLFRRPWPWPGSPVPRRTSRRPTRRRRPR